MPGVPKEDSYPVGGLDGCDFAGSGRHSVVRDAVEESSMKIPTSNRELYDYLIGLALELKQRGRTSLGEAVDFACGQASSSSTEFLGESRIALRQVLAEENGTLDSIQRSDIMTVLSQIDNALDNR